ncbi:MAG: ComEC family competence protein, partial [Parvibaculaceae bacterium]|nr:ComEC family competence protein [Parvibaculaceae bacterium]
RPSDSFYALQVLLRWIAAQVGEEQDQWALWIPVLFAAGIAGYFGLSTEPSSFWVLATAFILIGGIVRWGRRTGEAGVKKFVIPLLLVLLIPVLGMGTAQFRSYVRSAPKIKKEISFARLKGLVVDVSATRTGRPRLHIQPTEIEHLEAENLPVLIRVTLASKKQIPEIGSEIEALARLWPPAGPIEPGAYDFARDAWFKRIGATGFIMGKPTIISKSIQNLGWNFWITLHINKLRTLIGKKIERAMSPETAPIAIALITGDRDLIHPGTAQDLRTAGLAHILAISGLHMALVSGVLFAGLRALLALFPGLVLRYPIKKAAAILALGGATFYLLISGGAIATQRAYIMVCLMFLAILLDRPALSLRNVALAAIAIMFISPESVLGPSFQMSFAAVIALISFYEKSESSLIRSKNNDRRELQDPFWVPFRKGGGYVVGLLATSLIAGLATAPFAQFHFNRVASYGLLGNLLALPLMGAIVMPAAILALVLMPFGAEGAPLWVMEQGLKAMLWIAHWVAHLPHALQTLPTQPNWVLLLTVFGGLWLSLWKQRWRLFGILPILVGLSLSWSLSVPDILIDREGKVVAMTTLEGRYELTSSTPFFVTENWLQRTGDARSPKTAYAESRHIACDLRGCTFTERNRPTISVLNGPTSWREDCAKADVIVARFYTSKVMRALCKGTKVIDEGALARNGAYALTLKPQTSTFSTPKKYDWEVTTVRNEQGDRPWSIGRKYKTN